MSLFFLSGCIFDGAYKDLHNGYQVLAVDGDVNLALSDGVIIIPTMVVAVGKNDSFIIVKQNPEEQPTAIQYYIIPLIEKISEDARKNFYGPLSTAEFQEMKKSLCIENIDFTISNDDL